MLTNPTEATNSFELLKTSIRRQLQLHTATNFRIISTTKNFDPRLGFAWDVFGTGKTAIRAGIGMFDLLPLPYVFEIGNAVSFPFSLTTSTGSATNPLPQGAFR